MRRLLSLVEESVMLFNYDKTCGCCAGILLLLSHGIGIGFSQVERNRIENAVYSKPNGDSNSYFCGMGLGSHI